MGYWSEAVNAVATFSSARALSRNYVAIVNALAPVPDQTVTDGDLVTLTNVNLRIAVQ